MRKHKINNSLLNSLPLQGKEAARAFTLVELIVVITILAILGTIAFISLQGYSADARDSSRISDINHIKTSLELFSLDTGKYPLPDDTKDVTYSGTIIVWKQGKVGDVVTGNLSRNLNEKPTDPLYETEYIYSTLENGLKYEVMSVYEGDLAYNNNIGQPLSGILSPSQEKEAAFLISQTNAASTPIVRIDGTYNGMYVKTGDYIIPTPSIITSEDFPVTLSIDTIKSQVINRGTNIPNIGTSKVVQKTGELSFSDFQVYEGLINSESTTGALLGAYTALANTYSGSSLQNVEIINALLNQSTDEEKINFTKTVVLNTTSSVASSSTTTNYTCDDTTKPTDNGHIIFTVGEPASENQAYIQDATNCGYSCKDSYTGTNCEIAPTLITSTDCTNAGWIWVNGTLDTQGNGFCISPRFGDWNSDLNTGNGGISWNGWGNHNLDYYNGWNASSIDDTGNPSPIYGQTKKLDSEVTYNCKTIGTASSGFDISDTIVGRMKWLATTGNTYANARSIDWITGLVPHTVGTYPHAIPALYIADCIDGVKDLGTDMAYKHYPNESLNETITYSQYNTDVTSNTDAANLSDDTYQNRQKYLTAWTQKAGSHLPSAMSYIADTFASASDSDGDFLTGNDRGEYQVACDTGLFGTYSATNQASTNDQEAQERIWLSAIGNTTGTNRGRYARIVGNSGCGDQGYTYTGYRGGDRSARFVVRP